MRKRAPIHLFGLRMVSFWPALAALIAAFTLIWWLVPSLQQRTVVRQLYTVLDLLAPQIEPHLDRPRAELQSWAEELAAGTPLRLTLIAPDGTVVADTERTFDEVRRMDNHRDRPEVVMARADQRGHSVRRSTTTGGHYVYTARPVRAGDGSGFMLRVAQPLEEMAALRRRLAVAMAVAAVVGLLAMVLVSWHLDRRYLLPAARLIEDASRLAELGFGNRVSVPEQPDLAKLARVINQLTALGEEQLEALGADRDQLSALLADQDRLAAVRRDFVANVSHELKTPLAAIRGYAETLRDGALSQPVTAQHFVERVLGQCHRLEALLADLLVLSRLESVSMGPDPQPVDLSEAARRAYETVRQEAEAKDVTLELELEEVGAITGRSADLDRMLVNLLQNAIKYNRPGGRVWMRLRAEPSYLLVEIEDTGFGIPQEALPRIFERFYRVDKGRSRAEGGTGLGLSIVKHIVQAHEGEIEVESRPDEGSLFRLRLPLESGQRSL